MKRLGIDPHGITTILVTHLHGDHFCGIPFLIRETQIISQRSKPLTIAGPGGLENTIRTLMKVLFPGSRRQSLSFDLNFVEIESMKPAHLDELYVTLYPAIHSPATNPHSIRIACNGRIIAYSGDTEWNPNLIEASQGADLFICECFEYEGPVKNHIDYRTLLNNRHRLSASRIVLTHMNESMLAHVSDSKFECAVDGMTIVI
jgi:ribonuclease BN (tRNA processing enzyme)